MVDITGAQLKSFSAYLAEREASTDGVSMVPGLNGAGTGGVRVPYSANGEVPADNGFFIDDNPTTQIHRFRDRIFFGDGAKHTGRRTAPFGGSWMTNYAANYFEKNATVTVLSDEINGRAGLIVGAYTPPDTAANMNMAIGVVTLHRGTSSNGRGVYIEAMHSTTAGGNTDAIEIQCGNYGAFDPSQPTSYSAGAGEGGCTGIAIGAEAGHTYVVGDDDTPIVTPTYPVSTAIRIGGGSLSATWQRFRQGLLFMENSLYRGTDGTTGNAQAIGLASGYEIKWHASHTVKAAVLRSDVTAIANQDVGVIFTNNTVKVTGTGEAPIATFHHTTSAVNYLTLTNSTLSPVLGAAGTGTDISLQLSAKGAGVYTFVNSGIDTNLRITNVSGRVEFNALGSVTNADIRFVPKGTGLLRFGAHTAIGAETITGYISIKDDTGVTRKLAVVS